MSRDPRILHCRWASWTLSREMRSFRHRQPMPCCPVRFWRPMRPPAKQPDHRLKHSRLPLRRPRSHPVNVEFDVPLTYEDLVLPIEIPGVVQERFNATAAVQSIQMEKKRMANKAQPRMETIVATEKKTPDETTDSVFASSTPNVGEPRIMQPGSASASAMHPRVAQPNLVPRETTAGTLASTPVTPAASSNADPLDATAILPDLGSHDQPPSIASQAQQRHWIRQPK